MSIHTIFVYSTVSHIHKWMRHDCLNCFVIFEFNDIQFIDIVHGRIEGFAGTSYD